MQAGQNANLGPVTDQFVNDYEVVKQLAQRYKTMSDRLEERIEITGKKDPVTQDLLIALRSTLDLHLYKLRSFMYK
ncbi:ferritin-like domain-containing protein [Leeuwenhoekiella sp. NPDC079379]|uniref:ferritin-like domain-containing protein n=1 Tax=Leeuwenhoekiella sp. NPDC079379 TaxID=3364122 RepID=UPI0037C852D5